MRNDPDSTEIKPVRIPTRANRWIIVMLAVGVPNAGITKQFKPIIIQGERRATKTPGIKRTSRTMPIVPIIIQPPTIMEERK
jgi:hypothetical protein